MEDVCNISSGVAHLTNGVPVLCIPVGEAGFKVETGAGTEGIAFDWKFVGFDVGHRRRHSAVPSALRLGLALRTAMLRPIRKPSSGHRLRRPGSAANVRQNGR